MSTIDTTYTWALDEDQAEPETDEVPEITDEEAAA